MRRLAYEKLLRWKDRSDRKPLIMQGVRQCGKTWLLKNFGENEFEDCAYFNFETITGLSEIFEKDLDINRIIIELSALRRKAITAGKTLLILDEIQICPRAITALKYFAEDMPQLHVAAAGSLLGIALSQMGQNTSFPVGKVHTLTLYPLNFHEYLLANGEELLCRYIEDKIAGGDISAPISTSFGERLDTLLRHYYITGGMPSVVKSWTEKHDVEEADFLLDNILSDYEKDFVKYAPKNEYPKLMLIWNGIAVQLAKENKKFVFTHVKSGLRARDLEDALYWLISAGLIHKVEKVEKPHIPLSAYADLTFFKIYLCDVGLLRKKSGFTAQAVIDRTEKTSDIRGILAENFVLTELVADSGASPYYWRSEGRAEVDFLIQNGMDVIPIEVKSGVNTHSRSLAEYRKRYRPALAMRLSLNIMNMHNDDKGQIYEIPLTLLWASGMIFRG
ncbi:MAG: ATP-binding protein [Methanomicrobium sp.]|nr:ATP-binding protein [Methanomicrobium sp.]